MKKRKTTTHEHLTAQQFMATFSCVVSRFKWSVLSWLVAVEIMTHSFLLLGCKVDLSIPPWSVLWSGNQIISCNYLFLWLLDLLLLASFTDMLFSPEQPWGCSLVVLMDDDTLKEANTEVLIWIWIRIHTSQGPFLAIFAMELAECNANKTCTLKRVICTVCFCTCLINAFTAMLAVPWLGKRPKCQIWNH